MVPKTVCGPTYRHARVRRLCSWLDNIKERMEKSGDWSLSDEGNYMELRLRIKRAVEITAGQVELKRKEGA